MNRSNRPWAALLLLALALPAGHRQRTDLQAAPAQAEPELFDATKVRDVSITLDTPGDWINQLGCQRRMGGGAPPSDEDFPATLVVDGTRLEQIGVRCKGNSSLGINGRKKPFNLTTDAFVDGQTLWGHDVINLNNNWNDPSQLREALALQALAAYMPTPRFGFARVTVGGEYLGLYTMVEQVDRSFGGHWYPRNDGGLIIKGDSPQRIAFNSSGLTWDGEGLAVYKQNYEVKGRDAGSDEAYTVLQDAIRALDAPVVARGLDDSEFAAGIAGFFDVDSALWYLAGNNLLANFDSYYVGKNFYLYRGSRDEVFHVIPWDLGLSYGLFGLRGSTDTGPGGGGGGNTAAVDPFAQIEDAGRPLVRRLLAVPEFRADYVAHYRDFLAGAFSVERIDELGGAHQDLIREAVRDEVAATGWVAGAFTFAQFEANLREPITAGNGGGGGPGPRGATPGIRSLVAERSTVMASRPDLAPPDLSVASVEWTPVAPTASDNVVVEARLEGADAPVAVELRVRVNGGREERLPMTNGTDGLWSATIAAQRTSALVTFALRASLVDGRAAFFPAANQIAPYRYEVAGLTLPRIPGGDVVINEFLADNATILADPSSEYDDWVELFNRGTSPAPLGGMYISDNALDPLAFALPDIVLAPGEYVLVWCDNDSSQGADHASFSLARDGESVVLSTSSAIVDEFVFGSQATDISYARRADGAEEWVPCLTPSPRASNTCAERTTPPPAVYLPRLEMP